MRLNRTQFSEYLVTREKASFVLEACGGAHHWARVMQRCGHSVRLLPVPYVCAYRCRNKTDRTDCLAMLEAAKNPEILPAPVKTQEHQAIQGLHRCRSSWMETRTARINTLRGLLREFGIVLPVGAATALLRMPEAIDDDAVPPMLQVALQTLLEEIRALEQRIVAVDRQLEAISLKERTNHNMAACALANKLARIAWATWRHGAVFDPNQAVAAMACFIEI